MEEVEERERRIEMRGCFHDRAVVVFAFAFYLELFSCLCFASTPRLFFGGAFGV